MSESDIDMDRAMQGIDDADSHVPEITWTNCADAMPPDDELLPIILYDMGNLSVINAAWLHCINKPNAKWCEHTPEKWKELNK